jgi:hypothetical protein
MRQVVCSRMTRFAAPLNVLPPPVPAGNALGLIGVSGGIAAALGSMHATPAVYAQVLGLLGESLLVCRLVCLSLDLSPK